MIASSNESFLPYTKETLDKLAAKHPPPHPDTNLPDPPSDLSSFNVSKEEVRKMIQSFRNGSSGGADGLTPGHLKDLSGEKFALGNRLCEALATFYNKIVFRGLVPDEVYEIFYGAKLFGLAKPNNDVRPIAIGCTLRRLGCKLAMSRSHSICASIIRPHQVGVGVKRGAESSVHALRRLVCDVECEDWVILKVDMANAFNQVRRDKVLEKVKDVAPQLFPMAWQAYGKPTKLLFGEHCLMSCEGVQQGDVLGSLLFSLAIQDMVNECRSPFNSWYLDDGVLGADPKTIEEDYLRLVDSAAALGLRVKPDKCQISILNPRNSGVIQSLLRIEPEFKVIDIASLDLLGAPHSPCCCAHFGKEA